MAATLAKIRLDKVLPKQVLRRPNMKTLDQCRHCSLSDTHTKRYRHLLLHVSFSVPFIRCESKSTCMFFSSAKVHTSLNSLSCVLVFRKAPYFQICTLGCDLSVKAQPVRSTIAPSVLDLVKIVKFDQFFLKKNHHLQHKFYTKLDSSYRNIF
jgi:hypothetical protein